MIGSAQSPVGGHLALEFTNTNSWDPSDPTAGETLNTYRQLLDWALARGLISRKSHGALGLKAEQDPAAAARGLDNALATREAMHIIFSSYAAGEPAPAAQTAFLNTALQRLSLRLHFSADHAAWDWTGFGGDLDSVVDPVVWAAASLLTSPDLDAVKQCAGDRCGWLFLDTSRRHNRKWCDMRDCGNRAKARRHYYRHRGAVPAPVDSDLSIT